ncbi:MAG: hypothetical protein H6Q17_2289 [Bacteroidetes bacterium]|nr:hypothetical protein [Bacteroidota bacterium]
MILLEEPYISQTLVDFLEKTKIPILSNNFVRRTLSTNSNLNVIEETDFIQLYRNSDYPKLYTVSEYALDWIYKTLGDDKLTEKVSLMKDKAAFRRASSCIYEDLCFLEISYANLAEFDISTIALPAVLKPSVGFLSAGVYTITDKIDWENAITDIHRNFVRQANSFPDDVVKDSSFILESYIQGREFAIDLYFKNFDPVIINIFEHPFSSGKDVSDRLYYTNKVLFDNYLSVFTEHISRLNNVLKLDNIPVHIELRVDERNRIVPIEINPLRFAGLCLNELHCHITGKHPLSYFFESTIPDYTSMWNGKENTTFCFSIFEKPEEVNDKQLDINKLKKLFHKHLEIRAVNNSKLNILAFVFSETETSDQTEINNILHIDTLHLLKYQA